MKKINRRIVLLVMSLVLVISVAIGATMAYFSAYDAHKGEAALALKGGTEIEEETGENQKIVTIHNTGETVVVVRVAVYGPEPMDKGGEGWTKKTVDGTEYWYYDKEILPGGQSTPLTAKYTGSVTDAEMEIIVVHESETAQFENGKLVSQDKWFK